MKNLDKDEIRILEEMESKKDSTPKKKIAKSIPKNWIIGLVIVGGATIYFYSKEIITGMIALIIGGFMLIIIYLFMQQQEIEDKGIIDIKEAYAILKKELNYSIRIGELPSDTKISFPKVHKLCKGQPIKYQIGYTLLFAGSGEEQDRVGEIEAYSGMWIGNKDYPMGFSGREEPDYVIVNKDWGKKNHENK